MLDPSPELLREVRGQLIRQGTSLTKWCSEQGISRQWATAALVGYRRGPAASTLVVRIISAVREGRL